MPKTICRKLAQAHFAVCQSDVFRLILAAAFRLRAPRHEAARRLIDQLGICLFAEHVNASAQAEREFGADRGVRSFLDYVDDHFHEEYCLENAHKAGGVSRNTLIARLRKELQTTPGRYLWRVRTERGAAMLCETGHTVAEISYNCGLKNPFHFSRLVKQHLGVSPREVRKRAWSQPELAPTLPARKFHTA